MISVCYVFLLFFWSNSVYCSENSTVEETLKLLEEAKRELRFSNETKQFILIVGKTGMGKTPLTKWLTVDNSELISEQASELDPFLMKDTDGKIGDSITTSATIFPDLYMSNGTAYYDFPGFRDTRRLYYTLATIYTIKKVVDFAESVKIVIVTDYDSVKVLGARDGLKSLLDDMSGFIKDVSKFSDSISLIVTKIPPFLNNFQPTDAQYINRIGQVLLQIKSELLKSENTTNVNNLQKAITIIDIVTANNFSKIGLFRLPDRAGPFSEIPLLREGKQRIEDTISALTFTNSSGTDFHIPVHNELKGDIQRLLDEIIGRMLIPEISSVFEGIRLFYVKQMAIERDISALNATVSVGVQSLAKITTYELISFVDELLNTVHTLDISTVPEDLLNNVTVHIRDVSFLNGLDPKTLEVPPQFVVNIRNITELIATDFVEHCETLAERSLRSIAKSVDEINVELVRYHDAIESELTDLNELNDKMTRFATNLTDIQFDGLQIFSWQISELFNLTLPILEFNVFSTDYIDDKSFNELKALSQDKTKFDRNNILNDFICVKMFSDSSKWYKFLVSLYNQLSDNLSTIDSNNLLTQCLNEMNKNKRVTDITELRTLVNGLTMLNDLYDRVQDITISPTKMRELVSVIKLTNTSLEASCASDTLTVSGHIVRTSRVQEQKCWSTAKNIEIFSFNKFHLDNDIDLTGRDIKLSIVAPTWKIIGNRKINLNGVNGKSLSFTPLNHDGDPGLPGGSGGQFLGIGDTFIDSQNLIISACGGKGGAGQNGKKGLDGTPGVDPVYTTAIKWIDTDAVKTHYSDFKVESDAAFDKWYENIVQPMAIYSYKIHGTAAILPTNGGNGGAGGIGGFAGGIQIVNLGRAQRIKYEKYDGEKGVNGEGGSGGEGKQDGKILARTVHSSAAAIVLFPSMMDPKWTDGLQHEKAADGVDGSNVNYQHKPMKVESINLPFIVRNYKKHLREKLVDSAVVNNLQKILYSLNENTEITAASNGLSFIHEFQDLESQYYYLHQSMSFKPFLETLLHQIKEYSGKNIPENDKIALSILYPAIYGKIIAVGQQHGTIFVISKYLKLINKAIVNFNEYSKQENIKTYGNDYRHQMEIKIKSATHLIDTQLIPEIDGVIANIDRKIDLLLNELAKKRDTIKDDVKKTLETEKKLQKFLLARKILAPIKIAAGCLSALGPKAAAAGAVIGGVAGIGEAILDQYSDKPVALNTAFGKMFAKISDEYKNSQEKFVEQLNKLQDEMDDGKKVLTEEDLRMKAKGIKLAKEWTDFMQKKLGDVSDPSIDIANQEKAKSELKEFTNEYIKVEKDKGERSNKRVLRRLSKLQSIVTVSEVAVDSMNRIVQDEAKLQVVADSLKTLTGDLIKAQKFQENIYSKLLPQINDVHGAIQRNKNLTGKSHTELGITKWQVQSTLRDTKVMIKKVTAGFDSEESIDLIRLTEKLDDGFGILIEIYDRLESYSDQVEFAAYVGEIGSINSELVIKDNTKLSDALISTKKIIQTNMVIERYNELVYAIKQHKFPFAEFYFDQFELPKSLANDEPEVRTQQIKEIVAKLNEKLIESQARHKAIDNFIAYDDLKHDAKRIDAFYEWKNGQFKDEIAKLLSGDNITILADVNNVRDLDAVKFKNIGIYLRATNETVQAQLDRELLDFSVSMSMVGNNFFRCEDQIFSISMNDEIVINISFEKDSNGFPIATTETVKMINTSDFVLSPYTWWIIKLENRNASFDNLKPFRNETIDLMLEGRGQYIRRDTNRPQVCNANLRKYYTAV